MLIWLKLSIKNKIHDNCLLMLFITLCFFFSLPQMLGGHLKDLHSAFLKLEMKDAACLLNEVMGWRRKSTMLLLTVSIWALFLSIHVCISFLCMGLVFIISGKIKILWFLVPWFMNFVNLFLNSDKFFLFSLTSFHEKPLSHLCVR